MAKIRNLYRFGYNALKKKIKKFDARSRKKENGCIFDLQTNH